MCASLCSYQKKLFALNSENQCLEDYHKGTIEGTERLTYNVTWKYRTACVIATSKARDVFEPFLHQVSLQLLHLCCDAFFAVQSKFTCFNRFLQNDEDVMPLLNPIEY